MFAIISLLPTIAWFDFALTYHPFQRLGLPPQIGWQLVILVPVVVIVCLAFVLRFFVGRPPAMQSESVVRRTAHSHIARMRWFFQVFDADTFCGIRSANPEFLVLRVAIWARWLSDS